MYNSGWVFNLGPKAKLIKRGMKQYSLGYLYSTAAYYGVPASGTLKLFLPYEKSESAPAYDLEVESEDGGGGRAGEGRRMNTVKDDSSYSDSMQFLNIVVCGANENYGSKQCNMETDIEFIAGEEKVTEVHYIDAMGVSDRGKQICVTMAVPSNATLTTEKLMMEEAQKEEVEKVYDNKEGKKAMKRQSPTEKKSGARLLETGTAASTFGLSLQISVTGRVRWEDGPCIVSHVIWEQARTDL